MKKRSYFRPLVVGLSLAVVSTGVFAYGKHQNAGQGCQQSGGQAMHQMQEQARGMMMMQMPADLVTSLKLSAAQKVALFEAQTAANAMRDGMRANRQQAHQRHQEQATESNFDPRVMFEQQDLRMAEKQSARKAIQAQWLGFWDRLSTEQQSLVQDYLKANSTKSKAHHPRS